MFTNNDNEIFDTGYTVWAPGCCKGRIQGTSRGNRFTIDYTDDDNKIEKIFYGYPRNPRRWPKNKAPIKKDERYVDVTDSLKNDININGQITIPGGFYKADHNRTAFFRPRTNDNFNYIMDGPIYKEVLVVRKDGTKHHFSKWIHLTIKKGSF